MDGAAAASDEPATSSATPMLRAPGSRRQLLVQGASLVTSTTPSVQVARPRSGDRHGQAPAAAKASASGARSASSASSAPSAST